MAAQPPPEAKLLDKFSDGISALQYLTKGAGGDDHNRLLSSSWDGAVRLHDTTASTALLLHNMESGPLLSVAAPASSDVIVSGGLDGSIKVLDISTNTVRVMGRHDGGNAQKSVGDHPMAGNACSCLAAMNGGHPHLVASASWNRQLCLWDLRQQDGSRSAPVARIDLPGKAFAMDVNSSHDRILVATSGRRNCIFDLRRGAEADGAMGGVELSSVLDRDSSLKFQTRCVRFFPDGHGFCVGSIEGRVGVEFLEELGVPTQGMKKYAFKCHRVGETVYPVNVIAFHPTFTSTFATGGCDGTVILWDGEHKKKLTSFPAFPTSISAVAFSPDGTEVAIASSYTHEEGDRDHPQDEVYVRKILDHEVMPKAK